MRRRARRIQRAGAGLAPLLAARRETRSGALRRRAAQRDAAPCTMRRNGPARLLGSVSGFRRAGRSKAATTGAGRVAERVRRAATCVTNNLRQRVSAERRVPDDGGSPREVTPLLTGCRWVGGPLPDSEPAPVKYSSRFRCPLAAPSSNGRPFPSRRSPAARGVFRCDRMCDNFYHHRRTSLPTNCDFMGR